MKIFIRGGVWTNVEDQVLLAAYMKYGGNQWLRIASLLPRKSPAQVKARWEEYIDPTLRKSSWTTREDEKLLHLAKLMPMQWRTISQYFGRSAYQCLERYRQLIDEISGTPHYEDNESAVLHEMMPNYETLKADPDPIEMDQDEKEMLAEARARLANTQGKKARRKARERQLDVLRKITAMKKKREQDAAGVIVEEKKMWEDEEFEVDVLTTHKSKDVKFDVEKDNQEHRKELLKRIQNKHLIKKKADKEKKQKQNKEENISQLKLELEKEKSKMQIPIDTKHTSLILPDPNISERELKNIEMLRHNDQDIFEQSHSLSLLNYSKNHNKSNNKFFDNLLSDNQEYESQVTINKLKHPKHFNVQAFIESQSNEIEKLIAQEMKCILEYDFQYSEHQEEQSYNINLQEKNNDTVHPPEVINEFTTFEVDQLIEEEKSKQIFDPENQEDFQNFIQAWNEQHQFDEMAVSEQYQYYFEQTFKISQQKYEKSLKKYEKKTQKYKEQFLKFRNEISELNEKFHKLVRDRILYKDIQAYEEKTLSTRIEVVNSNIKKLEEIEQSLDQEYQNILINKKQQNRKKNNVNIL